MSEESLFMAERKARILEILQAQNKTTVESLAKLFHVSGATIRTDLRQLHAQGLIIRTHGGALQKSAANVELSTDQKLNRNLEQKHRIAQAALKLVHDGDSLLLDTGTTTFELAKLLSQKSDLTIITNDLPIASLLEAHPSSRIYLLGGLLRKRFHCTIAASTNPLLSDLNVSKAFLGTNALSLSKGALTPDIGQAETKRAMIQCAQQKILLCDSSKLGKVSLAQFARIEDINTLITDAISPEDKAALEEKGVSVIIA